MKDILQGSKYNKKTKTTTSFWFCLKYKLPYSTFTKFRFNNNQNMQ